MAKPIGVEQVPVDRITPHPDNYNHGNLDAIAESLTLHDQYVPITVQKTTGHILRGNHTYLAARDKLGWEEIAVYWIDCTDDEALEILVADNWIARKAIIDREEMAAIFANHELRLEAMGMTERERTAILASLQRSTGEVLDLIDVTIDEPRIEVAAGEVWTVGPHTLACLDVFEDWPLWTDLLHDDHLFVPYPGPFVVLGERAQNRVLVMVQPDPYIASHIVTMYADVYGDDQVTA